MMEGKLLVAAYHLMAIQINPVRVAYAVMIIGVVFTFLFTRQKGTDLRKVSNEFVFPFVELSNYICPKVPEKHLLYKEKDGKVIPLPMEEQPGEIRGIMTRANEDKPVELFAKMVDSSNKLDEEAGINRTNKTQFADPIRETLLMTQVFLQGCENPSTIDTKAKLEQFESFLYEQVKHRMMLMRRISGDEAEHYRQMNTLYSREMEEIEREEMEKKTRSGKKAKKQGTVKKEEPAKKEETVKGNTKGKENS